jgi:hypothetical protein
MRGCGLGFSYDLMHPTSAILGEFRLVVTGKIKPAGAAKVAPLAPDRFVCHHCRAAVSSIERPVFGGTMTQSLTSLDSLLVTFVLATLAIGLPILIVLTIRFLWDRSLNLGRSKEFEKLIWQLHRIASAMEHQMNLSFPAVQPGTEEPRDLAYLQHLSVQPAATTQNLATPSAAGPASHQPVVQQTVTPPPADQQVSLPALERRDPAAAVPRAGVNSMFDL